MKHILNAAKVLFSIVVLTFTSWQTFNLLQSVVGAADPVTPIVGIALFAGGFVFWSNLYTKDKESTAVQHAAALGGAVLCMLLDGAGAALHLLVGGQKLVAVDQNIGWWIIGVIVAAAVVNIALLFIHETHNQTVIEQRRAANERHQEEEAIDQRGELRHEYRQAEIDFEKDVVKDTIRELKTQKRAIAQKLAKDRAHVAAANLLASMDADPARYLGTAATRAELSAPVVIEQAAPKTAPEAARPVTTFADILTRGGQALAQAVGGGQDDGVKPAASKPTPTPAPAPRQWVLDDLLHAVGLTRAQARDRVGDYSADLVYGYFRDKLPTGLTRADFDRLFAELKTAPAPTAPTRSVVSEFVERWEDDDELIPAEVMGGEPAAKSVRASAPKAPAGRPRKARG